MRVQPISEIRELVVVANGLRVESALGGPLQIESIPRHQLAAFLAHLVGRIPARR